jgi:uncharacterized protein (TIGR02452 family)
MTSSSLDRKSACSTSHQLLVPVVGSSRAPVHKKHLSRALHRYYASLITDAARPFYALHAGRSENYGFYTHAMIYSPEVQLFRDDDGGWLEPIPVDIVTSPAVNAGKLRTLYPRRDGLEKKIEDAMRERMGRILALFEMKGTTSLVLGSFGTGTCCRMMWGWSRGYGGIC